MDSLRSAENNALSSNDDRYIYGGVDASSFAENNPSGHVYGGVDASLLSDSEAPEFKNSVSGRPNEARNSRLSRIRTVRRSLPILSVFILLVAIGAFVFLSQTFMPFAVVNRLIEEFNTNGVSSVLRSDNLLDLQMSGSEAGFGLTDAQKSSFKENEIYAGEYAGTTTLSYHDSRGRWRTAVTTGLAGDTGAADAAREVIPDGETAEFLSPAVVTIAEAMNDPDFKVPYVTASKTWRGGNSGWYDPLATLGEQVNGYTRSRWYKYTANAVASNFEKIASSTIKSATSKMTGVATFRDAADNRYTQSSTGELLDEAGDVVEGVDVNTLERVTNSLDDDAVARLSENAAARQSQLDLAQSFLDGASTGASAICAGVSGFISVQSIAQARQRLQKINYASGYIEAVQKLQAGTNQDEGTNDDAADVVNKYNDRLYEKDPETGTSAMDSDGMNGLFTGAKINTSSKSVQAANAEKAITDISTDNAFADFFQNTINDGAGLVGAWKTCNYVQAGISVASAATSVIAVAGLVSSVFTVGASLTAAAPAISQTFGKALAKGAIKTAIAIAAPIVAQKVIEKVGMSFIKDAATEWLGEDLGNILVAGGNTLLQTNHQIGGGSPADETNLGYFRRAQESVIADQAEYERMTRSPFDMSSQYTFLGSIAYTLLPVVSSSNVGSFAKSLGSAFRSSAIKLLPSASAIGETELIRAAETGDCPTLESVEIRGDAFCNPLYVTDRSTVTVAGYYNAFPNTDMGNMVAATNSIPVNTLSPNGIIAKEEELGFIETTKDEETGAYTSIKIKDGKDNELSKYILYCGQRVSAWGTMDANIASALESEASTSKKILLAIPIISDIASFFDKTKAVSNAPWTTGSACVASSKNTYWNGSDGHNQLHQRFIEDQRWLVNIEAQAKDPISAYLEDYYQKNPLDNSYEGILARFSGLTKDEVVYALNLEAGLTYLANYDPSTRLTFGETDSNKNQNLENVLSTNAGEVVYERTEEIIDQKRAYSFVIKRDPYIYA